MSALEKKQLDARQKIAARRTEAIENRVIELMQAAGLDKLTGMTVTLTVRTNAPSLVVDDLAKIPRFLRTKTVTEADKTAIKVELQRLERAGSEEEVAGCHLSQSLSLLRK